MTQRKWDTQDCWEVLTGWDRPLQYFFVSISKECGGCDGEGIITDEFGGTEDDPRDCMTCDGRGIEFLFDNLNAPEYTDARGGMLIEQVKQVLDLKLTVYPNTIIWDLMVDKRNNAGNMVQHYGIWGEAKTESGQ